MTTAAMEIFCPKNHLMLNAATCPKCGWQRPTESKIGDILWGPKNLEVGIGGESRDAFASIASITGRLAIFPTRDRELIAISLLDGTVLWRTQIEEDKRVVWVYVEDGEIFVTLQDISSLMEGRSCGSINRVNPDNGELSLVWQSPSHDLTSPLVFGGRRFIRTSESKLYAMSNQPPYKVHWEYSLETWWAAPLVISGGNIIIIDGNAMFGDGHLAAIRAADGEVAWQLHLTSMPLKPLAANAEQLFCINGKKELLAINAYNGETSWRKQFPNIYTAPAVTEGKAILVVRNNPDSHAADHYMVKALDCKNGEVIWQQPLPSRVRLTPHVIDENVYIADEKGVLRVFHKESGNPAWSVPIGHEEDPIQTCVHQVGNSVILGTYFGKVVAITIQQPLPEMKTPEEYVRQQEWKEAAAAYALSGNLIKAAEVYINRFKDDEKAYQLYEHGNLFQEAGRLAFSRKKYSQALIYFNKAEDSVGKAETMLAMGYRNEASKIYYSLGEIVKAAELMETTGNLKKAAQYYRDAGKTSDYHRVVTQTPLDPFEMENLRAAGAFDVAAKWSLANKDYLEAAKDYRKLKLKQEELDALKLYVSSANDDVEDRWLKRIAQLGEDQNDYSAAGFAWIKLGRPEKAGENYRQLAEKSLEEAKQQYEEIPNREKTVIANFFQLAAEAFRDAGMIEEEEQCRSRLRFLLGLPKIMVSQVKQSTDFQELEWNHIELTLKNIGFGLAKDVSVNIGDERFELREMALKSCNLGADVSRRVHIELRPREDQIGSVMLMIQWQWSDKNGKRYMDRKPIDVKVISQKEAHPTAPPTIYQISEGGNVTTIYGGQHVGDVVEHKGSSVTVTGGGQSGRKNISVETERGSRLDVGSSGSELAEKADAGKPCPNCGKVNPVKVKHCIGCGHRFSDAGFKG